MSRVYIKRNTDNYTLVAETNKSSTTIGDVRTGLFQQKVFTDNEGTWAIFDGEVIHPNNLTYYNNLITQYPNLFTTETSKAYKSMTAYNAPAPQVAAASDAPVGDGAHRAFIYDNTTPYIFSTTQESSGTNVYGGAAWIQIDLGVGNEKLLSSVKLVTTPYNFHYYQFRIYGGNSSSYPNIELAMRHQYTNSDPEQTFTVNQSVPYRCFRVEVNSTYTPNKTGLDITKIAITRMELYATTTTPIDLTTQAGLKTYIRVA
jgi:hypothetical protein